MTDWKETLRYVKKQLEKASNGKDEVKGGTAKKGVSTQPPSSFPTAAVFKAVRKGAQNPVPNHTTEAAQAVIKPAPVLKAAPATVPPTVAPFAPTFREPDMSEFRIVFPKSKAVADQSWQVTGAQENIGSLVPGRNSLSVVGLDFGTAFTKACVTVRNQTYIVHWNQAVDLPNSFLLPSEFSELTSEKCVLGTTDEGKLVTGIKMGLLEGASRASQIQSVAFIALATRYIRAWLFTVHRDVMEGYRNSWFLNVGLPASAWENPALNKVYQRIALAGWKLGLMAGDITLELAEIMWNEAEDPKSEIFMLDDSNDVVGIFPEFGAQVHSYRSTAQRQRDLHLLVDVGAGTVDVVSFHIGSDNEEEVNCILDASVERKGTHILLGYRATVGNLVKTAWEDQETGYSRSDFESKFGLRKESLRPVQDYFSEKLQLRIRRLLHNTKEHRYPRSPAWGEGIPYYLTGGGASVDAFRETMQKCQHDWKMFELGLPSPPNLILGSMPQEQFHRLSVAHGLSFAADNLTRTLHRSETPDIAAGSQSKDFSENYIEK